MRVVSLMRMVMVVHNQMRVLVCVHGLRIQSRMSMRVLSRMRVQMGMFGGMRVFVRVVRTTLAELPRAPQ